MILQNKRKLFEDFRDQDFELQANQSASEILEIALSELGNLDPYIRDNLALEVAAYIIYNDYLTDNELKNLSIRLLSNEFLFYGLINKKEDSIFLRTFTSLLIAMLFRIPGKQNVLSDNELNDMYEKYLLYLETEYDYRGYVEHKGWAHFFAHSSDVLKYFFQQKSFNDYWIKCYLDAILKIIQNNKYVFHHNEDERFKNAFMMLFDRDDINQALLTNFLEGTIAYERVNKLPEDLNSYVNVKNIIRTIYFALDDSKQDIIILIKKLNVNLKVNE